MAPTLRNFTDQSACGDQRRQQKGFEFTCGLQKLMCSMLYCVMIADSDNRVPALLTLESGNILEHKPRSTVVNLARSDEAMFRDAQARSSHRQIASR